MRKTSKKKFTELMSFSMESLNKTLVKFEANDSAVKKDIDSVPRRMNTLASSNSLHPS